MLYGAKTHWNRKGQYYVWSDRRDTEFHAEMERLGVKPDRSFRMVFPSGQEELVYNLPLSIVTKLPVDAVEMHDSLEAWERHYYGAGEVESRMARGQGVPGRLGVTGNAGVRVFAAGSEASPERAYRGGKVSLQERLRQVRGSVSATEWAKRVGVSGTTVTAYEQGKSQPRVKELMAWAKAGGITLERLLRGVGVVEQKSLRDGAMDALLELQTEHSSQVKAVRKYIAWLESITSEAR